MEPSTPFNADPWIGRAFTVSAELDDAVDRCIFAALPTMDASIRQHLLARLTLQQRLETLRDLANAVMGDNTSLYKRFSSWHREAHRSRARCNRLIHRGRRKQLKLDHQPWMQATITRMEIHCSHALTWAEELALALVRDA